MRVLIVRHGEAVDEAPGLGDAGRWLTTHGREVTRRVARWLAAESARKPAEIWTSPLVRAVQTAEIVAEIAAVGDVSVSKHLAPGGDHDLLVKALARRQSGGPVALVGHEPSLSALAVRFLGDVAWPGFRKSGVASIDWSSDREVARLELLLIPKSMTVVTRLDAAD